MLLGMLLLLCLSRACCPVVTVHKHTFVLRVVCTAVDCDGGGHVLCHGCVGERRVKCHGLQPCCAALAN
jgi:hypothetical protein